MNKIRTINHLQDSLDREFSWRIKEIAELKSLLKKNSSFLTSTVIRAGIPMLYAHWEGFVKKSSQIYLNFVNCQRHRYSELSVCFVAMGLKNRLSSLSESKSAKTNVESIEFLFSELNKRANLKMENAINTESNLKSAVFENIASSIGIDSSHFETKYNFMDESLLSRRNSIAHGEYLDVGLDDYKTLVEETILLMRTYKSDIENAASLGSFLK